MRVFGFEFTLNCFIEVDTESTTNMQEITELIAQAEGGNIHAIGRLMQLSRESKSQAKLTTRNFHAPSLSQ